MVTQKSASKMDTHKSGDKINVQKSGGERSQNSGGVAGGGGS